MPGKIFVNYRRDDDPNGAARVRDGLAGKFGRSSVFMDVDNLLVGQRFDVELTKALAQCDVLVAIIGPRWMEILKARMASSERDYVQEEIAEALKQKLVVIPVLVGRDRQMPSVPRKDELPQDIHDLVLYQKHDVAYERFGRDIADLIEAIATIRKTNRPQLAAPAVPWRWIATTVVSALALGYVWAHYHGVPLPWPSRSEHPVGTEAADAAKAQQADATVRRSAEQSERQRLTALKTEEDRQRAAGEAKRVADADAARGPRIPSASSLPVVRIERKFRLASSFTKSMTTAYSSGPEFTEELHAISSSKLTAQTFPAGELVPAMQVLDAVKSGVVEMGWTYAGYYFGTEPALSVVGGGTPIGKSATVFLTWLRGEGRRPRDELFASLGIKALPCSIVGPHGLWLKKPLSNVGDLKGLKLRVVGPSGQVMRMHDVAIVQIPQFDLYSALERGLVDGAENLTPSMDEPLSLDRVAKYYYFPFGEATFSSILDLIIAQSVWQSMEPAARDAIEFACSNQLAKDAARLQDGVAEALKRIAERGGNLRRVPEPIATALQQSALTAANMTIISSPGVAV